MRFVPNNADEAEAQLKYHENQLVLVRRQEAEHKTAIKEIEDYKKERGWVK